MYMLSYTRAAVIARHVDEADEVTSNGRDRWLDTTNNALCVYISGKYIISRVGDWLPKNEKKSTGFTCE